MWLADSTSLKMAVFSSKKSGWEAIVCRAQHAGEAIVRSSNSSLAVVCVSSEELDKLAERD